MADPGMKPFCKTLGECTADDMVLMGCGMGRLCLLRFTEPMQQAAEAVFTVTLTDERGKTYRISTDQVNW